MKGKQRLKVFKVLPVPIGKVQYIFGLLHFFVIVFLYAGSQVLSTTLRKVCDLFSEETVLLNSLEKSLLLNLLWP